VVEVISDDSVHRDRVEKFLEYEREGVREYWIVDPRPRRKAIDVFVLEHGSFVPLSVDEEGWLQSKALPGFRVKEAWFTAEQFPHPLVALGELLPEALRQQLIQQVSPSQDTQPSES
jgi:Uma2 family endonuclease